MLSITGLESRLMEVTGKLHQNLADVLKEEGVSSCESYGNGSITQYECTSVLDLPWYLLIGRDLLTSALKDQIAFAQDEMLKRQNDCFKAVEKCIRQKMCRSCILCLQNTIPKIGLTWIVDDESACIHGKGAKARVLGVLRDALARKRDMYEATRTKIMEIMQEISDNIVKLLQVGFRILSKFC